ncbi:outer membrane protein assembly factor BamA [bacterium]|nr:outer membrane protein assembly factor BamA [bacterium]
MGKLRKYINKVSFFILFFFSFGVLAAEKIVNIDFKGLANTEESYVRSRITSTEGSFYSPRTVQEDIKALYKTGMFSDVSAERESIAGGVRLVFNLLETGSIAAVKFLGNNKIKDKALKNAISIRSDSPIDEARIAESEDAIRKLYEDKGLTLAEISHRFEPFDTEKNEQVLIFDISENNKVKVRRISFVGNKVFSDKKLAKQMLTKVKGTFSFLSGSGKLKDEKIEHDIELLQNFYLNNGYIKAKVGDPQITFTRDKKAIYINFPVHEGEQYKVGNVEVAGDIITTPEELKSKVTVKKGEVYNSSKAQTDSQTLSNFYGDQAYAFANIYPALNPDDSTLTADVMYNIQKGPKVYVERIDIKGNTITRDKVIRRELLVKENAPLIRKDLEMSQRRLYQLGYFEDIKVDVPRGSRDDTVILELTLKEKPTGSFNIGAGFSSLESFVFTGSVQKDNFFGYGIKGSVAANISKLRQEFTLSMSDRYFLDTRWLFSASLYRFSSALNQDFDQRATGGSVTFGRELFPFLDVNVGYEIEDVSITNFSAEVPKFFQRNASGLTSSLLASIAYDTRDNRLMTSKGMYHAVSGQYAADTIGSENEFYKVSAESRFFFKLPLKAVFKTRGQFSYINSINDSPVPLFERFFMGGINSLRGYDLSSVGPELRVPSSATGSDGRFVYGGNRMLLFNSELELPIYDPAGVRTVIFFDSGQAYAENESIDLMRLRSNYGVGLRWNSPFGPLRFEWGFPINKRKGDAFTVFNFSIGQAF